MKNISFKIYAFFFALLAFSLSSLVLFTQDNELHKAIGKEVPNIEIEAFTLYLLNEQAAQAIMTGREALRYEDREEIYNGFLNQLNNNMSEYIYAPFVLSKNRIYTFSQGADYLRLDGLYFWSKWGEYDYQKRIFTGRGDFILRQNESVARGQNILYNMNKGEIQAQSITADIALGGTNAIK